MLSKIDLNDPSVTVVEAPRVERKFNYKTDSGQTFAVPGISRITEVVFTAPFKSEAYGAAYRAFFTGASVEVRCGRWRFDAIVKAISPAVYDVRKITLRPTGAPHEVPYDGASATEIATDLLDRHTQPNFFATQGQHVNCRCDATPILGVDWAAPMKEHPVNAKKIPNKFYCAHPNVTSAEEQNGPNVPEITVLAGRHDDGRGGRWTRPTVDAAVEHARKQLEANPKLEHVAIVKIVKIVRRQKMPIVVEDVK